MTRDDRITLIGNTLLNIGESADWETCTEICSEADRLWGGRSDFSGITDYVKFRTKWLRLTKTIRDSATYNARKRATLRAFRSQGVLWPISVLREQGFTL